MWRALARRPTLGTLVGGVRQASTKATAGPRTLYDKVHRPPHTPTRSRPSLSLRARPSRRRQRGRGDAHIRGIVAEKNHLPRALASPCQIWDTHLVDGTTSEVAGGTGLLYIDRHLVHEVTSPQAFEGLEKAGRRVRRPDCTLVTVDHNIPTSSRKKFKSTECAALRLFRARAAARTPRASAGWPDRTAEVRVVCAYVPVGARAQDVHRGGAVAHPGARAGGECREVWPALLRHGGQAPRRCAHHRSRARLYPAGCHVRVRRLAHGDTRRLRRTGVWDRHVGSRACVGHFDAATGAGRAACPPTRASHRRLSVRSSCPSVRGSCDHPDANQMPLSCARARSVAADESEEHAGLGRG